MIARAVLAFLATAALGAAQGLTERAAIDEALAAHPQLAVLAQRLDAADGQIKQSGLRPNPLFVYQSEDFRTWQSPGHRFWQDSDHFFYLQQTFQTASKRARQIDVAAQNKRRAEIERDLARLQIATRVRAAYWDAASAERVRNLYGEILENFRQITSYHDARVREGVMAEADLIRIQLEQEKLEIAANTASLDAQRTWIRLLREMGRLDFSGPPKLDPPWETAIIPGREPTLDDALARRPELQLARQILKLNDAQTSYQMAMARPNVDGVFGYKRSKNFDTVMWGVQVPLPVFNRNQGNIESAVAERRAGEAALRSTESLIRAEHQAAVLELDIRRRQLREAVGPLRDRARRTAQIADAAYRLGGADLLRLLDAQRQRIDAELLYIQTLQGYLQSVTSIDAAAGIIP